MIYYVFLLFFVFDYLRPGSYVPGLDALRLNALIPLLSIAGTAVTRTPVTNQQFWAEPNTRQLGVLLGLLSISTLFARITMPAYTVTKTVFSYLLIYWIIVRQIGDVRRLKGVFLSLTVTHLLVAALNPAVFTDPGTRSYISSGAFLGDGNDFALSLNITIPLCLFLLLETRRKLFKIAFATMLLLLVLGVIATQSRGGTLALGAIGFYYWSKSQRKALTATLFVLVVVAVLAWAPEQYFQRMGMIADTQEGSAQGRLIAWMAAIKMAIANPLLGAGAGQFTYAYGDFYRVDGTPLLTAHSIYFLVLGELGLAGIVLLLTFIFSNLAMNRRAVRETSALPPGEAATARNMLACTSAALIAYAVGGAFLSAAYYPHMYVLAGLLAASRLIVREQLAARAGAAADGPALAPVASRPLRPHDISPEWRPRPAQPAARIDDPAN